ncbi:hypothetical protein [Mucilaginibacter celer]|uniref:DUF4251 domain-containing protein n=1 Tax=Mucilaginibacter celer TaxID=2305508 RepID=A0A494W2P8_9SPHI|nr:hypothetical protein [Mucilaginibacter celer]AYL97552.1 hypothetical protein HYN43_020615 [Mucilaginibacter celer]
MKKTLLFIILVAATAQLKAQNLKKVPASPFDQFLKLKSVDTSLSRFIPVLPQKGLSNNLNGATLNTKEITSSVTVYKMPVVKTYSNDRMPIVKTDEPGMKYQMLIKKLGLTDKDTTVVIEKTTP